MNILDADFTLYEIEQTLEYQLRVEDERIRTIGDLNITYEDYRYLTLKLKGLTKYITRIDIIEQYKLSIVTAMVFSIRYEKELEYCYQQIRNCLNKLQQHHLRYCIRICSDTFYELGLSTYGLSLNSIEDVLEVITMHAGLTKEQLGVTLRHLDEYYTGELAEQEDELYDNMDEELYAAYPMLTNKRHHHPLTQLLKEVYEACCIKHLSIKQISEEYETVSVNLIEACYRWYMKFSSNSNRLIQIR